MIVAAMSKDDLSHAMLNFIAWIPKPIPLDMPASVFLSAARARIAAWLES